MLHPVVSAGTRPPADASPAWIPKNPRLGETSESTVRSSVLRQRDLTPCCPNPGSLPMGLIALMRRLPLNGFNFHGIDAFLMSLTTCYSLAGGGASCS